MRVDFEAWRDALVAANAAAYEPALASSLNNLSLRLAEAERRDEGERAKREAGALTQERIIGRDTVRYVYPRSRCPRRMRGALDSGLVALASEI